MMERVGFEIEVQLYEIIIENIFYFQNVIFYTPKYAQNFCVCGFESRYTRICGFLSRPEKFISA